MIPFILVKQRRAYGVASTPWRAVQRAAWHAMHASSSNMPSLSGYRKVRDDDVEAGARSRAFATAATVVGCAAPLS